MNGDLAGTCSEHREPLVTRIRYGMPRPRSGQRKVVAEAVVVCPDRAHGDPERAGYYGHPHPPVAALRCAWCGDRLYPDGTTQQDVVTQRAYCSELHRLHAHRYRRRNS